MKLSSFNIWLENKINPENKLCFNTKSGGFAEFSPKHMEFINHILQNDIKPEKLPDDMKDDFNNLIMGSIIAEDNENEHYLEKSEFWYLKSTFDNSYLALTILPTLLCNCRCTYCYQDNKHSSMNQETMDDIFNYVQKRINAHSLKGLFVNWYGGEPLLMFDDLINLSNRFMNICNDNNVNYSAKMISNCTLLNRDVAQKLKECKISDIQVTFDGPKRIHNARRTFENNTDTFDVIAKNINECCGIMPFIIRVNIDKDNLDSVDEFFIDFKNIVKSKRGFGFYPGKLSSTVTSTCASIENDCLDNRTFSKFVPLFYEHALRHGFDLTYYPSPRSGGCCATSPHSMVIQPNGKLCRCWSQVGEDDESYVNIKNPDIISNPDNFFKWMNFNPYKISKCTKCIFFPICKSGCPATHVKATTDYMKKNVTDIHCCSSVYNLKEILAMHYKLYKMNKL